MQDNFFKNIYMPKLQGKKANKSYNDSTAIMVRPRFTMAPCYLGYLLTKTSRVILFLFNSNLVEYISVTFRLKSMTYGH